MTKENKKIVKLMKKVDSKLNYKKLHLEPIKEMEDSRHLKEDSYVNSVLDDMSYAALYGYIERGMFPDFNPNNKE